MAKFLGSYESGTPEWHTLRENALGGSEVGAALGLSPWMSPVALYYIKTKQIQDTFKETRNSRLGTLLEEGLFKNFVVEHPDWVCEYQPGTYAHDDYDWCHSNPDILITTANGKRGVCDLKYSQSFWNDVPIHYVVQVRFYMWVHDLDFAMVAGLIGGRWQEFTIERDKFAEEIMLEGVFKFWNAVTSFERPEWDGSDSTYEAMRQVYPDVINDAQELHEYGTQLLATKARMDEIAQEWNKIRSQVLDAMGNAKNGLLNGEVICYRQKSGSGSAFLKMKG